MLRRARTIAVLLALLSTQVHHAHAGDGHRFDDPMLAEQWNLQLIGAPEAWHISTGAGASIAVVDSGVDTTHEDLHVADGITFGGCESEPQGCGNGHWLDPGPPEPPSHPVARLLWDVVSVVVGLGVGETSPHIYVHGTQVAGIASATGGNGRGIVGVAPEADLYAVNIENGDGYTAEGLARGIRWATARGADVINLSLGSPDPDVHAAIREAVAAGVVVVAAAGNHAVPPCYEPAALPEVVCVVAVDASGLPAWYSNRALKEGALAVAAPAGSQLPADPRDIDPCGSEVLSLMPMNVARPCDEQAGRPAGYGYFSGTSAAAPHVSGVAALLAAQCRTAAEIVDVMMRTARNPLTGARGQWDPLLGHGVIDAAAAVAQPILSRRAGC